MLKSLSGKFAAAALAAGSLAGVAVAPAANASSMHTYYHYSYSYHSMSECVNHRNWSMDYIRAHGGHVNGYVACGLEYGLNLEWDKPSYSFVYVGYNAPKMLFDGDGAKADGTATIVGGKTICYDIRTAFEHLIGKSDNDCRRILQ